MNDMMRPRLDTRTNRAAEGLPRWRWTTAKLVRLTELGAFTAEDRFELIGGEIVPMSPVVRRHEVVAEDLERYLRKRENAGVHVVAERQLNFADDTYTNPDILVRPAHIKTPDIRGDTVLLVVEVAATSLEYDLMTKAPLYARHGVREYWVVNAATLATTVHLAPGPDGYAVEREAAASDTLTPTLAPELAVRLAELDVD